MKIELEISKDTERALESLRRATGLTTDKDLFNNALTILDWAIEEVRKGHSIAAVDKTRKQYRELRMSVLEHAASAESLSRS